MSSQNPEAPTYSSYSADPYKDLLTRYKANVAVPTISPEKLNASKRANEIKV